MKAFLTLDHIAKDGRLKKRYTQPSRSLTMGFFKILYAMFASTSWADQLETSREMALRIHAPHGAGWAGLPREAESSSYIYHPNMNGECFGIMISQKLGADLPSDKDLAPVIGQNRSFWRLWGGNLDGYDGIVSDRYRYVWLAFSTLVYKHWLYSGTAILNWSNGTTITDLAYDGQYIWCSTAANAFQRDPDTGALITSWATPGAASRGIAYDPDLNRLWICDDTTHLIYRVTLAGVNEGNIACPDTSPGGLEYHGGFLYLVGKNQDKIYRINKTTGAITHSFTHPKHTNDDYCVENPDNLCNAGAYWIMLGEGSDEYTWGFQFPDVLDEVQYGGMEILLPTYAGANGSMIAQRHFTNTSGGAVTINKVGILAGAVPILIASDLLGAPISLLDTECLRVRYTFGITV